MTPSRLESMISKTQEITFRQKWDWIQRFFFGMPPLLDHHQPTNNASAKGECALNLISVGDIMFLGRDYDCSAFLPKWTEKYGTYFKVGNLETPIVENQKKSPISSIIKFNASPLFAKDFLAMNFNLVSLANNHALDAGPQGLQETENFLKRNNIHFVGTVRSPYKVVSINNIRVGFLAFTFGVNKKSEHDEVITYAWHMDEDFSNLSKLIQEVRKQSDVVAILCHWGHEFEDWPVKKQFEVAKKMQAAGVHLILGHHPHVPQGFEVLPGVQKALCLYSQGNFLSNSLIKKHRLGQINQISLIKSEEKWDFRIIQNAIYTTFLKSKVRLL